MRTALALIVLLFTAQAAQAQYKTFLLSFDGKGPESTNIVVEAGTAVEGVKTTSNGILGPGARLFLPESEGSTNLVDVGNFGDGHVVAGPALIQLSIRYGARSTSQTNGWYTLRFIHQTDSLTPSTAVVIPSDSKGPTSILLESSTNLSEWVGALPGTYGTSSQQRYFRVRAVHE